MIEKLFERIADALEEGNKLQKEALAFRRQLAGDAPAETPAPKEAKAPKPPKKETPAPEVLPDPEPEPEVVGTQDDGLGESITKADIREFHRATSAKGAEETAKVKAFFIPALIEFGALKADGKPNIDALAEDRYPEFMAAFRAAVG